MPITFSGRLVTLAIFVIEIEEVLDAKMQCAGAYSSICLKIKMKTFKMTEKETELFNSLMENEIKFIMEWEDYGDSQILPIFVMGDLRLCVDYNYLIESSIDYNLELRLHNLNDLINFLNYLKKLK